MLVVMAAKCAGWTARTGRKFFLTSCAPESAGAVWCRPRLATLGSQHSDTRLQHGVRGSQGPTAHTSLGGPGQNFPQSYVL